METSSKKKTVQNGGNELVFSGGLVFLRRFLRTVEPVLEDQFDDDVEARFLDSRTGAPAPPSPPVAEETKQFCDGKTHTFKGLINAEEKRREVRSPPKNLVLFFFGVILTDELEM